MLVAPLAVFLVTATQVGSNPETSPRIYGGSPVAEGELMQVVGVHVQYPTKTELCTGTVIADEIVLTAAHCLANLDDSTLPVRVFTGTSAAKAQDMVEVIEWAIHPDYCPPDECPEDDFDIAYLKLARSLDVGVIEPITDQTEYDEAIAVDARVTLVGYGTTDEGLLGTKHKVATTITDFTESGLEFYAGGEGKDSCNGDSGGPALAEVDGEWRLAGVLSRGYACGEGGVYGVPFPALCWLEDETGASVLPSNCRECECVDVSAVVPRPPDESNGCSCKSSARHPPALVLPAAWWAVRRRRDRSARVPR